MTIRLSVDDVRGIWAIMPTPTVPGAQDPACAFAVDLDETRRVVELLIQNGVDAIMINGTFGEAPTLREEEWKSFTRTVVETAAGRVPICAGTTTLNTRTTIERAKYARDIGAQGMLLGRPMWCELSAESMVVFYRHVAEAVPELGIIVYDNPEAFKGRIPPSVYQQLADIPQIVGAKYLSIDSMYRACMKAVDGRIRLMPLDNEWYYASVWYPKEALACWSGSPNCDPLPLVLLRNALFSGDYSRAAALTEKIAWTYEKLFPNGNFHDFSLYNIPLEKERMNAAGFIKAGPTLPPYHVIPNEYVEQAHETGRRWRQLVDELKNQKDCC